MSCHESVTVNKQHMPEYLLSPNVRCERLHDAAAWRRRRRRPRAVNFSPSVTDELVNEKEKYKNIADEMDQAFSELSGF